MGAQAQVLRQAQSLQDALPVQVWEKLGHNKDFLLLSALAQLAQVGEKQLLTHVIFVMDLVQHSVKDPYQLIYLQGLNVAQE